MTQIKKKFSSICSRETILKLPESCEELYYYHLPMFVCLPVSSCATSTCFLVILHLTIRMMTTAVHTNISSTSVNGITALRMIGIGRLVGSCWVGRDMVRVEVTVAG